MNLDIPRRNIYLIGYRATGKTTVGRVLAKNLSRPFIDADQYIAQNAGMTVSDIVSLFGWEEFRKRETAAISAICKMDNLVAATGGGVVLDPKNTLMLRLTGTLVWLDATAATIIARMHHDPQTETLRPSLTGESLSLSEEVKHTLADRFHLYEQASHIYINTENKDIDTLCEQIISSLLRLSPQ